MIYTANIVSLCRIYMANIVSLCHIHQLLYPYKKVVTNIISLYHVRQILHPYKRAAKTSCIARRARTYVVGGPLSVERDGGRRRYVDPHRYIPWRKVLIIRSITWRRPGSVVLSVTCFVIMMGSGILSSRQLGVIPPVMP